MSISLEEEFRQAVDSIRSKVKAATELVREAEQLSARLGIPMVVHFEPTFTDLEFSGHDGEFAETWQPLIASSPNLVEELTDTDLGWNDSGCSWDESGCSFE